MLRVAVKFVRSHISPSSKLSIEKMMNGKRSGGGNDGGGGGVRLVQAATGDPDPTPTDDDPNPTPTDDVMSDSFGEGYATRSDEEGFGGIYGGGNRSDKVIHKNTDYDKSQGSDVTEKEKARHQTTAG
ncbi:hypothetical protein Dimus_017277 [Dionaea muscipula]